MTDATTAVRLLLAYDGSTHAATAIQAAAQLMPGAEGVVVFVRNEPDAFEHAGLARIAVPDGVLRTAAERYERDAGERAAQVAERGRELAELAGFKATADVRVATSAWRGLCGVAADDGFDAIVCGARGQGAFSRALLGSTSSSLLHHADLPVLVVPAGAGSLDGPALIGYDGSDGARAAIATAAALLRHRPALVAHVWLAPARHPYAVPTFAVAPPAVLDAPPDELFSLFEAQARERSDEGVTLAREAGMDARGLVIESMLGEAHALSSTAEARGASVIVAGSRGHGALASTVLGSVSSGLVHNADRPVLVVRGRAA